MHEEYSTEMPVGTVFKFKREMKDVFIQVEISTSAKLSRENNLIKNTEFKARDYTDGLFLQSSSSFRTLGSTERLFIRGFRFRRPVFSLRSFSSYARLAHKSSERLW